MKDIGIRAMLAFCTIVSTRLSATMPASNSADDPSERGDVPGWVMITLMSAVLVAALLAVAGPALESMFNQAMDTVGG